MAKTNDKLKNIYDITELIFFIYEEPSKSIIK